MLLGRVFVALGLQHLQGVNLLVASTIVVVNEDKRVVGFIPHPEFIQGIVIVRE